MKPISDARLILELIQDLEEAAYQCGRREGLGLSTGAATVLMVEAGDKLRRVLGLCMTHGEGKCDCGEV